jgi:hypothetical protein
MNAIRYGIDRETGLVWSRMGSQVALPVLQYDQMVPDDNFKTKYELKFDVIQLVGSAYNAVKWTRKIPSQIKNRHREFWGMRPLEIGE